MTAEVESAEAAGPERAVVDPPPLPAPSPDHDDDDDEHDGENGTTRTRTSSIKSRSPRQRQRQRRARARPTTVQTSAFLNMHVRKMQRDLNGRIKKEKKFGSLFGLAFLLLAVYVGGAYSFEGSFTVTFTIGQIITVGVWALVAVAVTSMLQGSRFIIVLWWMLVYWPLVFVLLTLMVSGTTTIDETWIWVLFILAEVLTFGVFLLHDYVHPWLVGSSWFKDRVGPKLFWDLQVVSTEQPPPQHQQQHQYDGQSQWTMVYNGSPFHQHTCQYVGSTNDLGLPHGPGRWLDDSYHGEVLTGLWEDGQPVAPFLARQYGTGDAFRGVRLAYYMATDDDFGANKLKPTFDGVPRCGVASVECSIQGSFYRHLPQATTIFGPCPVRDGPGSDSGGGTAADATGSRREGVDVDVDGHGNLHDGTDGNGTGLEPPDATTPLAGTATPTATVGDCCARLVILGTEEERRRTLSLQSATLAESGHSATSSSSPPHSPHHHHTLPALREEESSYSSIYTRDADDDDGDVERGAGKGRSSSSTATVSMPFPTSRPSSHGDEEQVVLVDAAVEVGGETSEMECLPAPEGASGPATATEFASATAGGTHRTRQQPHQKQRRRLSLFWNLATKKDALVYFPGFNSCLKNSLETLGQFMAMTNLSTHVYPIIFAWPNGQVPTYRLASYMSATDKNRIHVGKLLQGLRDAGIRNIHFMSHSLGVQSLLGCFEDKSDGTRSDVSRLFRLDPAFRNDDNPTAGEEDITHHHHTRTSDRQSQLLTCKSITMLNPDFPLEAFVNHAFRSVRRICDHITMVGDRNDEALFYSQFINGALNGLGQEQPQVLNPLPPASGRRDGQVGGGGGGVDTSTGGGKKKGCFHPQLVIGRNVDSIYMPNSNDDRRHQYDGMGNLPTGHPTQNLNGVNANDDDRLVFRGGPHLFQLQMSSSHSHLRQRRYLDMDVIDTTLLDTNIQNLRHSAFNVNPILLKDLEELIVTGRRAERRSTLLYREGNIFSYCHAPSYVTM